VIVGNFHVIAVAIAPEKADAPLGIDPNGVLSLTVPSQRLQLISRRRGQDAQFRRGVELEEFPECDAFDGAETPAVMIMKKVLRLLRAKAPNHTPSILRDTLYVKGILERQMQRQDARLQFEAAATKAAAKARCRAEVRGATFKTFDLQDRLTVKAGAVRRRETGELRCCRPAGARARGRSCRAARAATRGPACAWSSCP
jgi:hypothetical protein